MDLEMGKVAALWEGIKARLLASRPLLAQLAQEEEEVELLAKPRLD